MAPPLRGPSVAPSDGPLGRAVHEDGMSIDTAVGPIASRYPARAAEGKVLVMNDPDVNLSRTPFNERMKDLADTRAPARVDSSAGTGSTLSAPPPATPDDIVRWLEALSRFGPGRVGYDFVLKHGRAWPSRKLPKAYRRGREGECWGNSQRRLLRAPDKLIYVEGYAWSSNVGLPFPHAWLADDTGEVLDLTWANPELSAYFGVAFRSKYVLETMVRRKSCWQLIDTMDACWPRIDGRTSIRSLNALARSGSGTGRSRPAIGRSGVLPRPSSYRALLGITGLGGNRSDAREPGKHR